MLIPPDDKKFYRKNLLDRAIDDFASQEKPTIAALNRVKCAAQIQRGINAYRAAAKNMTVEELENEVHDSKRLGDFMAATGDPRPHRLCDAHAIISGNHTLAGELRAILAWFQRRIDDPINGCWLPRNTEAKAHMSGRLKNAIPHSRIHRTKYYRWLENIINLGIIKTDSMLVQVLRVVELQLQSGNIPSEIMRPIR